MECEIVGEASNGASALPEILRLKPDVVFADISMPVMDGLQMAEKVLKENPSQKIILLTSYKDFEYVHQGMKIGVTNYLLKNEVTEESLKKLLTEEFSDMIRQRRERHFITEHNIRTFLLSPDEEEAGQYEYIYAKHPLQRYALLRFVPRPTIVLGKPVEEVLSISDIYQVEELAFPEGISCKAFIKLDFEECCGVFFVHENAQDVERKLKIAGRKILDFLGKENYICMVSALTNRFLELRKIYQESKVLQEYAYQYESAEILGMAQIQLREKDAELDDWNFRIFSEALRNENREETMRAAEQILARWRGSRLWEYTECVKSLWRFINDFVIERRINPSALEMRENYCSVIQLEHDFYLSIEHIFREIDHQKEKQFSKHILLAKEFVYQNYQKDISISDIADAAGISEGHLRRCFKQELKTTVVAYLTDYRLERVKQLMQTGEHNIDTIWKRTGFSSAQYFSHVFKKNEGMSPREYMKKIHTD